MSHRSYSSLNNGVLFSPVPVPSEAVRSPKTDNMNIDLSQVRSLKIEINNLQCENSYLQNELDLIKNELNKFRNDVEVKQRRILRLENELFIAANPNGTTGPNESGRRRRRSVVSREKELKDEIKCLENINASLRIDLEDALANAYSVSKKSSELEKEKLSHEKTICELEETLLQLREQVESGEKLICDLQITNQDLRDVIDERSESFYDKEKLNNLSVRSVEINCEETMAAITDIKLIELQDKYDALTSELAEAKVSLIEKEQEINNITSHINNILAEKTGFLNISQIVNVDKVPYHFNERLTALNMRLKELDFLDCSRRKEVTSLVCRNYDLESQMESLHSAFFSSMVDNIIQSNLLKDKEKSLCMCQNELQVSRAQIEVLESEKTNLSGSLKMLMDKVEDLNTDNVNIQHINESLVDGCNQDKIAITCLQIEVQEAYNRITLLTDLYDEANSSLIQKTNIVAEFEEKVTQISEKKEAEINNLKETINSLTELSADEVKVKKELSERILTLENELCEIKNEKESLSCKLMSVDKEEKQCYDVIDKLNCQLVDLENKIKTNLAKESDMACQIQALKNDLFNNEQKFIRFVQQSEDLLASKSSEITKLINEVEIEKSHSQIASIALADLESKLSEKLIMAESDLNVKCKKIEELEKDLMDADAANDCLQEKEIALKNELHAIHCCIADFKKNMVECQTEFGYELKLLVNEKNVAVEKLEYLEATIFSIMKDNSMLELDVHEDSENPGIAEERLLDHWRLDGDLSEKLSTISELLGTMKSDNVKLNFDLEQIRNDLQYQKDSLIKSNKEKDRINLLLKKKCAALSLSKSKVKNLKSELCTLSEKVKSDSLEYDKTIDKMINSHSKEISAKNFELQELSSKLDEMTNSLEVYCNKYDSNKQDLENITKEKLNSEKELENVKALLGEAKQSISAYETEVISLQESLDSVKVDLLAKDGKITFLARELASVEKLNSEYAIENTELIAKLMCSKNEVNELKICIESASKLENQLFEVQSRNCELISANVNLKSEIAICEEKLFEYTEQISALKSTISQIEFQVELKEKEYGKKVDELNKIKLECSCLNHELCLMRTSLQELSQSYCDREQACEDLVSLLNRKTEENEYLICEKTTALTEMHSLFCTVKQLEIDLKSIFKENKNLKELCSQLNCEKREKDFLIASLEEENEFSKYSLAENTKTQSEMSLLCEKLKMDIDSKERKMNLLNDANNNLTIQISQLECEKVDCSKEIIQLHGIIEDLSFSLFEKDKEINQVILHNESEIDQAEVYINKTFVSDGEKSSNSINLYKKCHFSENFQLLKSISQHINQLYVVSKDGSFDAESGDHKLDLNNTSNDFENALCGCSSDGCLYQHMEFHLISSLGSQFESMLSAFHEKDALCSDLNIKLNNLLEEIRILVTDVEHYKEKIKELEIKRADDKARFRSVLDSKEIFIEQLQERVSFLEDSESHITAQMKIKIDELTKLSFDLGQKLKEAHFEKQIVQSDLVSKEASFSEKILFLENLLKDKEIELLKFEQDVKMLEHEKTVLNKRVTLLTKDVEDHKCCGSYEQLESNDLQLTDEQKLTLKPALQKELRSCFESAMEQVITEADDKTSQYKDKLRKAESHIEELSCQLWESAEKQLAAEQEIESLNAQISFLQSKLEIQSTLPSGSRVSFGLNGFDNPGLDEISDEHITLPPQPAPQSDGRMKPNNRSRAPLSIPRFSFLSGKVFPVADEEEEMFNETCLSDLKAGIVRLNVHPQSRYLSCPPNSLVEKPLESNRPSSGARSLQLDRPKKEVGQTSYRKPGPPTPSKNGGRLSFSELSPPMVKETAASIDTEKENRGKIKNLFTVKSKIPQETVRKKGFFRRRFGRENPSIAH